MKTVVIGATRTIGKESAKAYVVSVEDAKNGAVIDARAFG